MVITTAVVLGIILVVTIFVVITTFVDITTLVDVSVVGTGEVTVVAIVTVNSGVVVSIDGCDVTIIALLGTNDVLPSLILGLAMVIIVFDIISVGMTGMLVISVNEAFGDDATVVSMLVGVLVKLEI